MPAVREKTGNWKACRFILGNECCERLAYYGMGTNLVNYLEKCLNMGNVTASNTVTNWSGTCYITPLIGAFLADSYLGRYWTIASFSIIYVFRVCESIKLFIDFISILPVKQPQDFTVVCNFELYSSFKQDVKLHLPATNDVCHPNALQTAICFIALYLIAIGTGGIKPCVSSFGADQFDETDETERKKKSSFFNWFYLSINIGALIASSVLVWIQMNVGWGWGFGIPAVAMAFAVVFFFSGSRLYRLQKPGGSPLTRIFQVVVVSMRKSRVEVPDDKSLLYETADEECNIEGSRKLEHTDKLRFFDKAAVETESDHANGSPKPVAPLHSNPSRGAQVHHPVAPRLGIGNCLCHRLQPNEHHVCSPRQHHGPAHGTKLQDPIGLPLPLRHPQRHLLGPGVRPHHRLIREKVHRPRARIHSAPTDRNRARPFHIFHGCRGGFGVPQYFLVGCAEVFTFIGQLEFFYDQAPDAMRSLCSALSLTTVAFGNYLSTLLVTIVTKVTTRGDGELGWIPDNLNRGHLDYFYWLLAVLSVVNFIAYLWISKWYTYKKATGSSRAKPLQSNQACPFPHTRGLSHKKNNPPVLSLCKPKVSNSEDPPLEGDAQKQELLATIAMLQTEKVRVTDYLDERSAYLTEFAEKANAELEQIGETLKELEEASATIMENLDSSMQEFKESAELNKIEIEENEKQLAEFEGQIEKDRNEGLFFKNLRQMKPDEKAKAKEEMEKIKQLTIDRAGSKTRQNIYLALIGLLVIGIADSLISSSSGWQKVAILGLILVGLISQLIYEQKILLETERTVNEKIEEKKE
ncbi:peptide transporter 1 [Actinidia rufa]|uniref:Peptide transporter 1 n=1 Tax=Actinidia rufa TaxID=165716 RepID=A0A7J0F3C8_9ERIC|nr:peptide transporter 1 [Actinidia rufa]